MRILICILLVSLNTFICFSSDLSKNDSIKYELNIVVDELIRFRLNRVSVVISETMPIHRIAVRDTVIGDSLVFIPPDLTIIDFSKTLFDSLIEQELIDSLDAKYMYSNIDSSIVYSLEPSLISKPLLSKDEYDYLFVKNDLDSGYLEIRKRYGTSCLIKVGTPSFNKCYTKLILAVDYFCGSLYGQGYIFILEKINNKWRIIRELGTWES